jgi:hypothetical protein
LLLATAAGHIALLAEGKRNYDFLIKLTFALGYCARRPLLLAMQRKGKRRSCLHCAAAAGHIALLAAPARDERG